MSRQSILTRYLGPTNHRGARVKAWNQAKVIALPWNHALNPEENHEAAIKRLRDQLEWGGHWAMGQLPDGSGYAAVYCEDAHLEDECDA